MTPVVAVWTAALGLAGTSVFATLSDAVFVDATCRAKHWETVFTNEVPLRWNWATNAESATLGIVGMNGSFSTNVTTEVSNVVWQAFSSATPSAEDVYDLTLTFFNGSRAVIGVQTARLAVVIGAFGGTAVNAVAAGTAWSTVKDNAVLPYDALWSSSGTNATCAQVMIAKIGGVSQTNAFSDTAGYYGWKIRRGGWGYGTFDLKLTFAGMTNVWTAELTRLLDGTAFILR